MSDTTPEKPVTPPTPPAPDKATSAPDAGPGQPGSDTPVVEKPAAEKPVAEKPAPDKSAPRRASPPPPPRKPPARSGGGRRWLAPLLCLLLIAACAFFAWQWWQGVQRNQGDWRAAVAALQHGHAQLVDDMAAEHRAATARMAQLEAELAVRQAPPTREQEGAADPYLLNEAIALASLAEQQLLLTADPQAARRLLHAADEVLARSDNPEYVTLRTALAADVERLGAAGHLDLMALMLRLNGLQAQVPALVVPRHERVVPGDVQPEQVTPAPQGFWARLVARLPIRVRDHQGNAPLPLDAESQQLLRLNLESCLQEARLALLQGRAPLYESALSRADDLLQEWFSGNDPAVASFREAITELRAVPVARALPDIGQGLSAMKQVREASR